MECKVKKLKDNLGSDEGIDLTRMECKVIILCVFVILSICIDLTRMECKVKKLKDNLGSDEGIDLTRMECKVVWDATECRVSEV